MKHMKYILIASLGLGTVQAMALKNADPAAGNDGPKTSIFSRKTETKKVEAAPAPVAAPVATKTVTTKTVTAKTVAAPVEETVPVEKPAKKSKAKKSTADTSAAATPSATPAKGSLEEQLKALDTSNQVPAGANREKMYAVQARYLPLNWKSELTFGAASNLTGDSFIRTQQLEAGYRLHVNDRWAVGLQHAWVDNKLKSSEVDGVKTNNGALPEVPYAISRTDLTAEYNVFYGKFRWSAETVSYFDQYIALGAAQIEQNTGTSTGYVGDVGFAFWIGKYASTRLGLKDYYYKEEYRSGAEMTHNLHAHLDLGFLF